MSAAFIGASTIFQIKCSGMVTDRERLMLVHIRYVHVVTFVPNVPTIPMFPLGV